MPLFTEQNYFVHLAHIDNYYEQEVLGRMYYA
jgi:hypothetical protein